MFGRLLLDPSWALSSLEGISYSRLDTQNLTDSGQADQGKNACEMLMILNHKTSIEMLIVDIYKTGIYLLIFRICTPFYPRT